MSNIITDNYTIITNGIEMIDGNAYKGDKGSYALLFIHNRLYGLTDQGFWEEADKYYCVEENLTIKIKKDLGPFITRDMLRERDAKLSNLR